jgi:hypothetical protein
MPNKGSVVNLSLKNTYGNYAYYDNLAYYEEHVKELTQTLQEFSSLRCFTLYIRHKLIKDKIFDDLVAELNRLQLIRIDIVIESSYAKEEVYDWTQDLAAGEVRKTYQDWFEEKPTE